MTYQTWGLAGGMTILVGDCREILPDLEPNSVSLVLTDPPYAVSRANSRIVRPNGGSVLNQDFFPIDRDWKACTAMVAEACAMTLPLLRLEGAAYWWCGHRQFGTLEAILSASGRDTGFLVWRKTNAPPAVRKVSWRYVSELCVWACRPRHFLGQEEMRNVLEGSGDMIEGSGVMHQAEEKNGHPTQKPLWLMERIILAATDPGDLILDPFMGSGTVLEAAKKHGRRAIGIELEAKFAEIAVRRLQQEVFAL